MLRRVARCSSIRFGKMYGERYTPSPPVYWNHGVREKIQNNLLQSIVYGQNLELKGLRLVDPANHNPPPLWDNELILTSAQGQMAQSICGFPGCGSRLLGALRSFELQTAEIAEKWQRRSQRKAGWTGSALEVVASAELDLQRNVRRSRKFSRGLGAIPLLVVRVSSLDRRGFQCDFESGCNPAAPPQDCRIAGLARGC